MKAKGKEIEMNFTYGGGLDYTYYDNNFFESLTKKFDHLINNENTSID